MAPSSKKESNGGNVAKKAKVSTPNTVNDVTQELKDSVKAADPSKDDSNKDKKPKDDDSGSSENKKLKENTNKENEKVDNNKSKPEAVEKDSNKSRKKHAEEKKEEPQPKAAQKEAKKDPKKEKTDEEKVVVVLQEQLPRAQELLKQQETATPKKEKRIEVKKRPRAMMEEEQRQQGNHVVSEEEKQMDVSPATKQEVMDIVDGDVDMMDDDPTRPPILDAEAVKQQEIVDTHAPTTQLELALVEILKRKDAQIIRLTGEVTKLKAFISKRKQTYKRKRKDEGAPTRALSAYNIFVQDRFSQLAKENEQALKSSDSDAKLKRVPPASLVASTGNQWKELPAEEKAHYEERAREDKKRYEEQMAKYQPPDKQANRKRNKTGYNMFFSAHVLRLKQTEAGVPSERGSVARLVGNAWKALSAEEKQYYEREADKMNGMNPVDKDDDDDADNAHDDPAAAAAAVKRPDYPPYEPPHVHMGTPMHVPPDPRQHYHYPPHHLPPYGQPPYHAAAAYHDQSQGPYHPQGRHGGYYQHPPPPPPPPPHYHQPPASHAREQRGIGM